MERVRKILEASIPSDEDGVIQEHETTNEFDDVPIVDEPDDDETETERKNKLCNGTANN